MTPNPPHTAALASRPDKSPWAELLDAARAYVSDPTNTHDGPCTTDTSGCLKCDDVEDAQFRRLEAAVNAIHLD